MSELQLSNRLWSVARWVEPGSWIADVGTDHGYIPAWLLLRGTVETAIAADIRPGPLERARATANTWGVADRMDLRLCDGLAGVAPHEVDTVVIAGMGGMTIAGILSAAPWTKEKTRLILQPMTDLDRLRQWLGENGYAIGTECVSRDEGKLYVTMVVSGGVMAPWTPGTLYAGRPSAWLREPLRGEYLAALLARARREKAGVDRSKKAADLPRRGELAVVCAELEEMLEQWEKEETV